MKENIVEIVNDMKLLSAMELTELKETLEHDLGVSMPVAIQQNVIVENVVEEQTEFDFILKSYGDKKINAIKAVRQFLGLSLVESKTMVESCPVVIKDSIPLAEAERMKNVFVTAGAEVEIK